MISKVINIVPVILFLAAATPNLNVPGISQDEVYYVPPVVGLLQDGVTEDYAKIDPSVIHLFGKPFPLMFNYYTSFLRSYVTLPVFALFGISVESIRLSSIALSAVGLWCMLLFAWRLTGNRFIALATGLFLALDASFIFYSHVDFVAAALMMALKGMALWSLAVWWRGGSTRHLWLGALFIGLGVSDRASFLWIPLALAPTFGIIYWKGSLTEFRRRVPDSRTLALALAAFCVGGALFIAFNLANLAGTFVPMLKNFRQTGMGVDNLDFFANLYTRLQQLPVVLGGTYLQEVITSGRHPTDIGWDFTGSPLAWVFPLAMGIQAGKLIWQKAQARPIDRISLFLVSMIFFILIYSCFSPTALRGHQLLMLYPFPHMVVALCLSQAWGYWGRIPWNRTAAWGVVLLIAIGSAMRVGRFHQAIVRTGGSGVFSDANHEIAKLGDQYPGHEIVCMDWGFNALIISLSDNRAEVRRNYYEFSRMSVTELAESFTENRLYLFHSEEYTHIDGPRADFEAALELVSANVETVRCFYQRDSKKQDDLLRVVTGERVIYGRLTAAGKSIKG
ncbi:MAG: hypothetical protein IID13_09550 [Candidatus Marinimicrobia bacterium]|nr:hypothetical protein [Candidatus Neomarinimicrobiota bacterium]